jgi:hypothetical protein
MINYTILDILNLSKNSNFNMAPTTEYIRVGMWKTHGHVLIGLQHNTWLNEPKDGNTSLGWVLDNVLFR